MGAAEGGLVQLTRAIVRRNHRSGLYAFGEGSRLELTDVGGGVRLDQSRALTLLGTTGRASLGVPQGHSEPARQLLHGLGERDHVGLHDEVDDVSTGLAAEAVVQPLGRGHVE